jgi:VanZ family protein
MSKTLRIVLRWFPSLLVMLMIFLFSGRPTSELPNFGWFDVMLKKSGHMIGYALLALSYWQILQFRSDKRGLAWGLAILYAISDEFHQSFVPGRGASLWDVLIFDNLGALFSLGLFTRFRIKRSDAGSPIAENVKAKSQ